MPTKTRSIVTLAALSLAVAACGADERGPAAPDTATRFVAGADGLYVNGRATEERLADEGFVSGTTRLHAGARITVLRFRDNRSAKAEAKMLLREAYQTPRSARYCDRHKETLRVPGVPEASGVVVDNASATGRPTKLARIVFSEGRLTFHLSAEAEAGAAPVAELKRAARRVLTRRSGQGRPGSQARA